MYLTSSKQNFENTFHQNGWTYSDLLQYQELANQFCADAFVSYVDRIKWNREFIKKMITATSPDNYQYIWVPTTGFIVFSDDILTMDGDFCVKMDNDIITVMS